MNEVIAYLKRFVDNIKFSFIVRDHKVSLGRIYFTLLFFLACYAIISVRLFDLTVFKGLFDGKDDFGDTYTDKSLVNHRGDILDRNGEVIALDLTTTSIYANPRVIHDKEEVSQKLAKIFTDLKYKEILQKLSSDKSFVWIKRNISPKDELMLNNEGIPGLYFLFGKRRAYPQGALFAHVVGYVGLDGDGLLGAEKSFDKVLKTKDEHGKPKNLYLSLETRSQGIVRDEVMRSMREYDAKGGVGILQDVTNGEIIALVSLPDYDPNNIASAKDEQLFNKATLGSYEVGSTFKLFTMASALDSGIVKVSDVYDVDTPIKSGRFSITDFRGKKGWLSVPEIIMHSSNIGIAQIAMEVGKDKQFKSMKSFGLFSELGIELPERSKPLFKELSKWSESTLITSSYGYGVSVSPLHVANLGSAMVNGGRLYNPTILKNSHSQYTQIIKEETSDYMRKIMRLVVKHGSGKKADVEGLFVGGKSGTANKSVNGSYSGNLRISSFLAEFPSNSPKYLLYIMLDEPKANKTTFGYATGGWVAAPAVSRIIKRLSPVLNIAPQLANKETIEQSLFLEYNPRSVSS